MNHARELHTEVFEYFFNRYPERALCYYKDPPTWVWEDAIDLDPMCIRHLPPDHPNWTEMCMRVLEIDPFMIYHIPEPSEEMVQYVLDKEPLTSYLIKK